MAATVYDLWFDAAAVGADLVVECWMAHAPRANDPTFNPQPGDIVLIGDGGDAPLCARVVGREADRVTVKVNITDAAYVVR